ncbi:uncharacterized protein C56G2.4-like [Littorina saxatilis]|uniref:Uncharacterized protein n=1 Tax=Littorina saxatilis TaxID=31220 RepID=A0AAN9AZK0_9CAEN
MEPSGAFLAVLWSALFAAIMRVSADSHLSPCNPVLNTTECLAAVKQIMADEDRFWFGTSFNVTCPPGGPFDLACLSNDKAHLSIVTRVRADNSDRSVDTIQQVLNVTYDVPAGSYQACGQSYQVPAITTTLDPTVVTNISFWSTERMPHVSWTAENNKIYTVIMWDAGTVNLHGVWINIRGSSLDRAQTAFNYLGPKSPLDRDQPYVFLLYEQAAEVDSANVTNAIVAFLSESRNFAPNKIVDFASLSGPVGVSILTVTKEPYAVGFLKQINFLNLCPTMLTNSFASLPLSYNVSDVQLLSSLDVIFTSPEISFQSCCHDVTIVSSTRMTMPMDNGRIWPVYTRHVPRITLTPLGFPNTYYYYKNQYTLLLLDVTDELALTSDPDTLVHWQVVNIRQGDLTYGDTTLLYKAPLPLTGQADRTLMFLLLQQSAMAVNASDLAKFTGGDSCPQHWSHRCRFNLTALMTELGMKVEAASWFVTSPDLYSRQQAVLENLQPEAAACLGVPEYSSPCQTSVDTCSNGAHFERLSVRVLWLCGFVLMSLTMI